MGNISEYFLNNRPSPVWSVGDRVFGRWNKIPFIGTVMNDNMVSEEEGPKVTVFVDLPILFEEKIHTVIFVKQNTIKKLKNFDVEK